MIKKSVGGDEYYTQSHQVELIVPFLKKRGYKTILCPFDKGHSEFVKVLRLHGFDVVHGHIETGQDFFDTKYPEVDCVVSNPPFSKRDAIFKKLFQDGVPFALIMNMNGLFDSKTRFEIFKQNNFELLVPKGRMKFMAGGDVKNSPNFQSIYVCNGVLDKQIEFVDMEV